MVDFTVVIQNIESELKSEWHHEPTGHDWEHIRRVRDNALRIQQKEGGDPIKIELAALLHDISDHKFNGGKLDEGSIVAEKLLLSLGVETEMAKEIGTIVGQISFKGAKVANEAHSIEAQIVQDADRLDAIGAIGIARAFAFGGNRNRPIYDPTIPPVQHDNFEQYAKGVSHTINHFYEKLLTLKSKLNTPTGLEMAVKRHLFLEQFLEQFLSEWNTQQQ